MGRGAWLAGLALVVGVAFSLGGCLGSDEAAPAAPTPEAKGLKPDSPIAVQSCKINRATMTKAAQLVRAAKGRLPADIKELERSLTNHPTCLSNGVYSIDDRGVVSCSVHGGS
jgi:hypothetical protein